MPKKNEMTTPVSDSEIRSKLSQLDVPAYSLEQCLRVPEAIIANYARRPTAPLRVAQAMNIQPKSSNFRMLTGAAIAYGLIKGGAQAPQIELLPLAIRILRPTKDGDEKSARREALLKPKVVGQFLRNYDGNLIPREDIARNVLVEMGVPDDRTEVVLDSILSGARQVGFIQSIKGKDYIYLEEGGDGSAEMEEPANEIEEDEMQSSPESEDLARSKSGLGMVTSQSGKVYLTHGKNQTFLEPLKKLIKLVKLEPIVTVERQSVSKPLPDKVISDMRSCDSAIIHVEAENIFQDSAGKEQIVINPNVLIEIGAALALFGRRFILLVRQGVQVPSNLSGLYEVRYEGDVLDGNTTLKLLEALGDMQNHEIPDRYSSES